MTCFFVPPEKAASFFAAIDELPAKENVVLDGRLYSLPNVEAVTFACPVPGVVDEKGSFAPDADATVML